MRYKLATTKKFDKEYARLSESDRKTVDSVVNMILEGIHLRKNTMTISSKVI